MCSERHDQPRSATSASRAPERERSKCWSAGSRAHSACSATWSGAPPSDTLLTLRRVTAWRKRRSHSRDAAQRLRTSARRRNDATQRIESASSAAMLLSAPCVDRPPRVSEARASWLTQLSSGPASPEERPGNGLELRVGARERIAGCGGKLVEEDAMNCASEASAAARGAFSLFAAPASSRRRNRRRDRRHRAIALGARSRLARAPRGLAHAESSPRGAASSPARSRARPPPPPPTPARSWRSPAADSRLVMKASTQAPPVGGPVILDLYADW